MSDKPKMTPEDFENIMGAIEGAGGKVVRVEKVERTDGDTDEDDD